MLGRPLYRVRSFLCVGCGAAVSSRRPKGSTKYCSLPCYRSSKRPARMTGKIIACETCGANSYRPRSQISGHSFCGSDCANAWQRRTKDKYSCKVCEVEFYWSPSRTKQRYRAKYCSIGCRNKCPEWRTATAKGNEAQSRKRGPNRLELAGRAILAESGLVFEEQRLLYDKFLVDAYIPDHALIVQWDGEYWHGHPRKLKAGIPDARQDRRMKHDRSQDAYFRKAGLRVLRFWESDVYERKGEVLEAIRRTVQKTT